MEYSVFLKFVANNFLFSFAILLASFIPGWWLYNSVILRKISLKDSLFEKDNLAAWIEFIGAFIFPTLYLAAKAIEGSVSDIALVDLGVSLVYALAYILIFTLLRLCLGTIVKSMGISDTNGKIGLNSEIYEQKNVAASLFSVTLSTIFVSIIKFIDVLPGYFYTSILKATNVIIFTLIALIIYSLMIKSKTTLFKEIFIDNNPAAGVGLLGFIFAVEILLDSAISLQAEFAFFDLAIMSLASLAVFAVLATLFKYIFCKIIKVDIWNEIYEQDNIGAAIGLAALYIGIANVIVHFMK